MHSVIESLLAVEAAELPPNIHLSSHWQHHRDKTVVEHNRDTLNLRASGFDAMYPKGIASYFLGVAERLSYRHATMWLRFFPVVWKKAKRLCDDLGCGMDFYVFRSACALAVLMEHWDSYNLSPKRFAIIGDGYGFLGALIRRMVPDCRLYTIDLSKVLIFQARTHEKADSSVLMSRLTVDVEQSDYDAFFVLPQEIPRITEDIDCVINIASMQEMNAWSIATYFKFLRRLSGPNSHFYCVNREKKEMPEGEISYFLDYPWSNNDEIYIDEVCSYYTHWFSMRYPFVRQFDGQFMHRLVHLEKGVGYEV